MSDGFTNAIVGGAETLIRSAIRSFNYVAGIAGWRIAKNGTAELNDATIRGSLSAGGGTVLLNNNGLHIQGASTQYDINATAGFLARKSPDDGTQIQIVPDGIFFTSQDPSPLGSAVEFVQMSQGYFNAGAANEVPNFIIFGNGYTGKAEPFIVMAGQAADDSGSDNSTYIDLTAYQVKINGNDFGKGFAFGDGTTTASGATGATETTWYTIPSFTYKANRVYRFDLMGHCTSSVANTRPIIRVRKENGTTPPTGVQLGINAFPVVTAGQMTNCGFVGTFKVGSSDVTCQLAITLQGSGAFNVTGLTGPQNTIDLFDITDTTTFGTGRSDSIPTLT